jgi:phosphatidylglycerol:prolipoprotein diacylglycerol transferase
MRVELSNDWKTAAAVFMTHWIHHLDPVAIPLHGDFGIRWYGLAYAAAFLIGGWLLRAYHRHGRSPLDEARQSTLLLAVMIGVLAGGRLGYIVLYEPELLRQPGNLFAIWRGGMASHGGFVGVILACLWAARTMKVDKFHLGDVLVTLAPPGFLLGRLANFINGELWGRISDVAWAVKFPTELATWPTSRLVKLGDALAASGVTFPPGTLDWTQVVVQRIQAGDEPLRQLVGGLLPPRHPSQLYAAGLEGVVLLAWSQWRLWRTDALTRPGRLAGEFLLLYAVLRIFDEQFREPDAALILGVSRGIFYSLFLAAAGLVLIARSRLPSPAERPA